MISVHSLLRHVPELVGDPRDSRWTRASLTLRGSDGVSREDFFGLPAEERVRMLSERVMTLAPWRPLLQVEIPKGATRNGTRHVTWATILDTGLVYLLTDAVSEYGESVLTAVAIAYRRARPMQGSIRTAIERARRRRLNCICALDIRSFYDSIPWVALDRVIEGIPAESAVHELLKALVRVEVRRVEDGARVVRDKGIAQGLPVSPLLANLVLARVDRVLQVALGKLGCILLRYADDIIVFAPDMLACGRARQIVSAQLGFLGLSIKEGTGTCVDLRVAGVEVRWLGLALRAVRVGRRSVIALDVPNETIEEKAAELGTELAAGFITQSEVDARLSDLRVYYEALLAPGVVRSVIVNIRQQILPFKADSADKMTREFLQRIRPGGTRKEVTGEKKIEELIHLTRSIRRVLRRVDSERDGGGSSSRARNETETIDVEGKWGAREEPAPGHPNPTTAECLELFRPAPARTGAVGRNEVPSDPHLSRTKLDGGITVWAEPDGSNAVLVTVRDRESRAVQIRRLELPDSRSKTEAVLAGFEHAVSRLVAGGANDIVLTTSEATVTGYVARGWRVGSLRVLRRLRAIQRAAEHAHVKFVATTQGLPRSGVDGRRRRHDQ